jgi:hypothetical protein
VTTAYQIRPRPTVQVRKKLKENPKYLAHLRTLRCCHCNRKPSDPAHTGSRDKGIGTKAWDIDAIPLCRSCHNRYHQIGEWAWLEETGINLADVRRKARAGFEL